MRHLLSGSLAAAVALAMLSVVQPAFADQKHHPAGQAAAPSEAGAGMPGQMGMMGDGSGMPMMNMPMMQHMMQHMSEMMASRQQQMGMTGGPGMGSGGAGPMMGSGQGMMMGGPQGGMMGGPRGMMMPMFGMGPVVHVEGRIAFLKAELAITEAQEPAWSRFADGLRGSAKAANKKRGSMIQQGDADEVSPVDRLTAMEQHLQARLEAVRAVREGLADLYPQLSDEQKQAFRDLMHPRMAASMGAQTQD